MQVAVPKSYLQNLGRMQGSLYRIVFHSIEIIFRFVVIDM